MFRIIKALFFLAFLAFLGLVGYAYLGDLSPRPDVMTQDIQLNVD